MEMMVDQSVERSDKLLRGSPVARFCHLMKQT